MKIFSNYNYESSSNSGIENHICDKSYVVPGQAYSVEDLLRRSLNGTFPDLTSYDNVDFDGRTPEDMSVPESPTDYDDDFSPEHAMQEYKRVLPAVEKTLKKSGNYKEFVKSNSKTKKNK